MKFKVFCLFVVIFSFTYLTGCFNAVHITSEQSAENFKFYKGEIEDICEKYDVKIIDIEKERSFLELHLSVSGTQKIYISMTNSTYYYGDTTTSTGKEDFSIGYNKSSTSDFNVDLFVELVNAISGKTLSKEFCQKFLDAPEEDYPCERYGDEKEPNEKSYKLYSLNLFENWFIADTVYDDNTEELVFIGLTKTGTNG